MRRIAARRARNVAAHSVLATVCAFMLSSCAGGAPRDGAATAAEPSEVILASTTSTQDSGLFDELIPAFEAAHPRYSVKVVAVGTGEALKLGENKDADVLLVHATADEERFVADGHGLRRSDVMYNDFVVVGPSADPAKVEGSQSAESAFARIAAAGADGDAIWVSRGDGSGTHRKELALWTLAGVKPPPTAVADAWYESTGQGMGETLKVASEKGAYTLADRATYLSMREALDSRILYEKDDALRNRYGVVVVAGARNQAGGETFADWVLSAEGQRVIGGYGVKRYGQPLFVPNAAR